jgi:hypothetical protein
MIRLLTAALLFASFHVAADTEVPHTFTDGTPAKASEVNANFDALEAAIDAIPEGPAGEQGPVGPQGEQGEKGDKGDTGDTGPQGPVGNNGASGIQGDKGDTGDQGPAGADGVAAGLNCTADQIIKWDGSAWVCVTEPITAFAYTNNVRAETALSFTHNFSQAYCLYTHRCDFSVGGVSDHTQCVVQVSGTAADDGYNNPAYIYLYSGGIIVSNTVGGSELHVTAHCLP